MEKPIEDAEETVEPPRGRKRRRQERVRKKGLRQNAPQESITADQACCKKACMSHIPNSHLTSVRQHFSTLEYNDQNVYLASLMIRKETKKSVGHKRKTNPATGKCGKKLGRPPAELSSFSVEYMISNEKGLHKKICQKSFILIHGFGKRRLEVLRKKITAGSPLLPEQDRRGKHSIRPRKVSCELHSKVREHIMSFKARQSHYSRRHNPGRLYLSPELSVARMYQMFLAEHDPPYVAYLQKKREAVISHQPVTEHEVKPIVSEHYYHDVFVNEFNIHFGYPRSDTCDTCDGLKVKIDAVDNDEEKLILEKKLQDHLALAEQGYDSLRKDCQLSVSSWSQVTEKDGHT